MELWVDGIDRAFVERTKELGILHGITTNPSILAKSDRSTEMVLQELLDKFAGPIAVQVTTTKARDMIEQGKILLDYSPRIIVKIPVTEEGIHAISRLTHHEIPTMGTAIFEPTQAFLAAQAGASYLAPYFAHIGENAFATIQAMHDLLISNSLNAKLCIAALRTPEQVEECIIRGFHAATLKPELFKRCLQAPSKTDEHLAKFAADWQSAAPSDLLASPQLIN